MAVKILVGDVRERLAELPDESVNCVVTSPPYYGLRDYGIDGQMGLEPTPNEYIAAMVDVFRDVRRVLRADGTCWLNVGDSFANDGKWGGSSGGKHVTALHGDTGVGRRKKDTGLKPKDLMMVPARLALALQADGWWLRSDIIWHKPNPMPESVRDRPTNAHEHIFLLTKSSRYWYDADAVREPMKESSLDRLSQDIDAQVGSVRANGGAKTNGTMKAVARTDKQRGHSRRHAGFNDRWDAMPRDEQMANGANLRNVWSIATVGYPGSHFATFPPEIPRRCIKAGCPADGTVLDPFFGAGTTGLVADELGRNCIGIELNPGYAVMAKERIRSASPMFADVATA